MRLNPVHPIGFSLLFSSRRRLGLGLAALLTGLALSAQAATYNLLLSNAAPNTLAAYLTNGVVEGVATNWQINAVNTVQDPYDAGVTISLSSRVVPSTLIFSYWSGSLTNGMDAAQLVNPVVNDLIVNASGDLIANLTNRVNLRINANIAQGTTLPVCNITTAVPLNSAVSVSAIPSAGYEFWYWTNNSGSVSIDQTNAATTLVTPKSIASLPAVTAVFRAKKRLTVSVAAGSGEVYMNTAPTGTLPIATSTNVYYFSNGEDVSLFANGLSGDVFRKWTSVSGPAVLDPSSSSTSLKMTNDAVVAVEFGAPGKTLILLAGPNGKVNLEGNDYLAVTNVYVDGSPVTISATPDPGFGFVKWTQTNGVGTVGAKQYDNPANYVMDMDRKYMAHFTNTYALIVYDPAGPGSTSNVLEVVAGAKWSNSPPNSIIGVGNTRLVLAGYTEGSGDVFPTSGVADAVVVLKAMTNSTFRWLWQTNYYLETVLQAGGESITPSSWNLAGSAVSVSASPLTGYVLASWLVNGVDQLTRLMNITVTMDAPKKVEALFVVDSPQGADGDHLPTWFEEKYGLDPVTTNDPMDGDNGDPDNDGLSNLQEYLLCITNGPAGIQYFMNPINADSDNDGMDDYFEVHSLTPSNLPLNQVYVSAAMDEKGVKGQLGNPDGDFKWDATNGYEMLNMPLNNIDEWRGPDGADPCTYETKVGGVGVFTSFSVERKDVVRRVLNLADSGDQSNPLSADTDNDSFDDGYEFTWDEWQRVHAGERIDPATNWPAITAVVPDWTTDRWYHPAVPLIVTAETLEPDFDWLYVLSNGQASRPFAPLDEYQASSLAASSNYYPIVRVVQRPERWCTHPFLWDADSDGLPDGWELSFGYDPWNRDTDRDGVTDGAENPDGDAYATITVPVQCGTVFHYSNDVEVVTTNGFFIVHTNMTTIITNVFVPDMTNQVVTTTNTVYDPLLFVFVEIVDVVTSSVPVTTNYVLLHNQVLQYTNYNPWTAWVVGKPMIDSQPYSNTMEFAGVHGTPSYLDPMDLKDTNLVWGVSTNGDPMITNVFGHPLLYAGAALRVTNATPHWTLGTETNRSTNPRDVDTDKDGAWDGWEYYYAADPGASADGALDADKDGLFLWQEFMGHCPIAYWRSLISSGSTPNGIQPEWSSFVQSWPNKGLPSNANEPDTDNDQIADGGEQTYFNYLTNWSFTNEGVMAAAVMTPGGGLNPCSVDSDLDYLPDFWEAYWTGAMGAGTNTNTTVWVGGMDGTVSDDKLDYDGDGVYNYQEYMVGACYQFQWKYNDGNDALTDPVAVANNYDPYNFFDLSLSGGGVGNCSNGPGAMAARATWDTAYWADRMVKEPVKRFTFLSAAYYNKIFNFSTCSPGNADTDFDGYDDYYELYHCLNPIRGEWDRVSGKLMGRAEADDIEYSSAPTYATPFRWGERPMSPVADFDQDGQVDVQENLTTNLTAVQTYTHTDPSPYFVSDVSSDDSYVNKFYKTGNKFGRDQYWYWDAGVLAGMWSPAAYLFSFEMNEGFDTDNDLASDSDEIIGLTGGATDPLDEDSPLRQRALYLNGVNAAARLYSSIFHSWYSFRAFTVEAWVKPISLTGDRVIVERAGTVTPGNPGFPGTSRVTRNFRLGIKNGVPYISYDGYGVSWTNLMVKGIPKYKLVANKWTHLAAIYDPTSKQLMLLVNGELAGSKSTTQIPFNGFVAGDPNSGSPLMAYGMTVTVGAADENPSGVCDGTRDNIKSGFYNWYGSPGNNTPVLANYFHGWIDEVHLWDGARTANQVRDLRTQKMTRTLINSLNGVQTGNQTFQGDMGGSELNPKMLYCFTFDGLPNPTNGVVPAGFDSVSTPGNIPWWDNFPLKSTVYNDYTFVKWIQNMASHQPFDPPRDTKLLRWIVDGKTQNFPNSANPYTQEYIHGLGGNWEAHPQYGPTLITAFGGVSSPGMQRDYSGVYGDLLPLGGAAGDDNLLMWDGSLPTDLNRDQDGDGIPDVWEELHGLNPFNPLDADDDPDRDGLSTRQEYTLGSDPFGNYSLTQDVPDFFAYTNGMVGPFRFLGEEFTDMDYMDDLWEAAYKLNTEMFDSAGPNGDPDGDGWSNLAEFQELANLTGSGGGLIGPQTNLFPNFTPLSSNSFYSSLLGDLGFLNNQSTNGSNAVTWSLSWNDPKDDRYHPVPEMIFRFQYAGKRRTVADPKFVVLAYTDRLMEVPDASIRGTGDRSVTYPRYMVLNRERANSFSYEGSIREGQNWFWGFMDLNGDSVYQANEPAGFAGPVDVRWGSVGPIDIPLTDTRPNGFARFSWTPDLNAERYDVYIVDRNVAGAPTVFLRSFSPFRTFVSEADMRISSTLNNGFKRTGGYQWYVRAYYDNLTHDVANGMVYTKYTTPLPAPVLVWPLGSSRLRQSRETFEWSMDATVTQCKLTVKRRGSATVLLTQTFAPPARSVEGRYKMQMPIYIGDGVFTNGVYDYTLTVKSPVSTASATSQFRVQVGDYTGYSYSLSGTFIYPGKVTNGQFVAEAFTSPGFGGVPAGRCLIKNRITRAGWPTNVTAFAIRGLPADTYYVRVFLDQNNSYPNFVVDTFESQGWYAKNFYWPDSVEVTGHSTAALKDWVKVLMRDLDNDRLSDDWEYMWNHNFTSYGLGNLRGYTTAGNGILNVFECYGGSRLGLSPK